MRKKGCGNCGCNRRLFIKAQMLDQKTKVQVGFKWLCLLCFLGMLKGFNDRTYTFDKNDLYETIE